MFHALCCLAIAVVVGSSPIMIDLPFLELPETAPEATTANNTPASQPIPSGPYGDVLELPPADNVTDSAFYSVVENNLLWPNGIVPYQFSSGVSTNLRNDIRNAMNHIMRSSCVHFQECSNCTDRVIFLANNDDGCYSDFVGKKGGTQKVNFGGAGCWVFGTILHEILHAIGFYHEQARPDRDAYIRIVWENIKPDWRNQFATYQHSSNSLGSFDYQSVMLYNPGPTSASVDNRIYMYAINTTMQNSMGQRRDLSAEDIRKINLAYCYCSGCENCFRCSTGRCIPSSWKCDEDNDCGNWHDEQGCTRLPPCNAYQCSGGRRACIPTQWLCDGDNDCGNGEDEAYGTCLRGRLDVGGGVLPSCDLEPNFVRCNGTNATKECVSVSDRCNGKNDCGNYDDEIGCPFKEVCHGFKCPMGKCILWDQFCDGAQDCSGGEDEQKCKKS